MAAYLRCVDYLPRVFFSVPACQFCGLPGGNSVAHVSVCSQLYVRLCVLLPHVAECLSDALGGELVARCDFICRVHVATARYWGAVVPDSLVPSMRDSFQSLSQALIWTWFGLQWSKVHDVSHSLYVRVQCARLVLQLMVRELSNPPAALPGLVAPSGFCSPYAVQQSVPSQVPLLAQQVLAWLVRWHPRLVPTRREVFHVSIPHQTFRGRGPFEYTLFVCDPSICFLKDISVDRPVVLCSCPGAPAAKWVDILGGPGWVVAFDQHYSIAPVVDC